jgi:transposase
MGNLPSFSPTKAMIAMRFVTISQSAASNPRSRRDRTEQLQSNTTARPAGGEISSSGARSRRKQLRRIATRYEKSARAYLSMLCIAAARLWIKTVNTA